MGNFRNMRNRWQRQAARMKYCKAVKKSMKTSSCAQLAWSYHPEALIQGNGRKLMGTQGFYRGQNEYRKRQLKQKACEKVKSCRRW